ncbi:MAG: hypothetical protein ACE15C_20640 [Phycisphaerae bacterium]
MAGSIGVYLPAMALQRALGLVRVLLFVHLTAGAAAQYYLWTAGEMIFIILSPVVCLGSNSGLSRYVSFYEARGLLRAFWRRVRWGVAGLSLALTAVAAIGGDWIRLAAVETAGQVTAAARSEQMLICWAALANVLAMALWLNLMAFLYGMRVYRLASLVELTFAVLFTALGCAALAWSATGLALLAAHFISVVMAMAMGLVFLHLALAKSGTPREPHAQAAPATDGPDARDAADVAGAMARVLGYGVVALGPAILWSMAGYLSYRLASWRFGETAGATFQAFNRLDQLPILLATAAWAVVFTHVARRWEDGRRGEALVTLQASYKAVAMATMTLAVLVYLAAPWWSLLLPLRMRDGLALVGGQLMFFQVLTQLALLDLLGRLHERPVVMVLATLAGGAATCLLAGWFMDKWGPAGAALAAGVGMYAGGGLVAAAYIRATRTALDAGTHIVFAAPAVLLLPAWAAGAASAAACAIAVFTPWIFDAGQKKMLAASVSDLLRPFARKRG